jgi:hypothetical protein
VYCKKLVVRVKLLEINRIGLLKFFYCKADFEMGSAGLSKPSIKIVGMTIKEYN